MVVASTVDPLVAVEYVMDSRPITSTTDTSSASGMGSTHMGRVCRCCAMGTMCERITVVVAMVDEMTPQERDKARTYLIVHATLLKRLASESQFVPALEVAQGMVETLEKLVRDG